jgi:hypothetical protein
MSSESLPPSLRALIFGASFFFTGYLTGAVVDRSMAQMLVQVKHPEARIAAQFAGGFIVLTQLIQALVSADVQSPIGDGILMIGFFLPQRRFLAELQAISNKMLQPYLPYHSSDVDPQTAAPKAPSA